MPEPESNKIDLAKSIDQHIRDNCGDLTILDVIASLEVVKFEFLKELQGDNILEWTSIGLN